MSVNPTQKKATIIEANRMLMHDMCAKAGTQDPLIFVTRNENGSGSFTAMWESEAAIIKTLLPAVDDGTASRMTTFEQQKNFVMKRVPNTWSTPGVKYTIVVCKFGGVLMAKGELTFPTYHQLLTEMYPTALKRSQTQTKQARSFAPSSYAARTRTTTAHAHEDDELRRLRQRLAMQEESTRRQLQMQEASSRQRAHEAGGIRSAYHSLNNGLTMQQALWFTY